MSTLFNQSLDCIPERGFSFLETGNETVYIINILTLSALNNELVMHSREFYMKLYLQLTAYTDILTLLNVFYILI